MSERPRLLVLDLLDPADPKPMYLWFKSQGQTQTLSVVGQTKGYRTVLVIGHLAIDVLGVLDHRVSLHTEPDERPAQIWPVTSSALLGMEGVLAAVEAMERGEHL